MFYIIKFFSSSYKDAARNSSIFILLSLLNSILEVSCIFLIYNLILDLSGLLTNHYIISFKDYFQKEYKYNFLILLFFTVLLSYFIKFIVSLIFSYWKNNLTNNIYYHYSSLLFKHYLKKNYTFFLTNHSSVLFNSVILESKNLSAALNHIFNFLSELIILTILILFLLYKETKVTVTVIFFIFFLIIISYLFFKKIITDLGKKRFLLSNIHFKIVKDIFDGIKTIKILNKEIFFLNKAKAILFDYCRLITKQSIINDIPRYLLELTFILFISIVVIISIFLNFNLNDINKILILYILVFLRIFPGLGRIMSSYNNVNFLIPALKKVFLSDVSFSDFLAKDKKAEIEKNIINEQNLQVNFKNNIFIRDLNYYHFNDQRPFFNKLNLKINKNDCIGLVGQSGSGKSTLADLISGILKFNDGFLEIDGNKIETEQQYLNWQNQIGYVSQSTFIMEDSIKSNVAMGVGNNLIDEKLVLNAMISAGLQDFLIRFKYDLNSILSENGSNLSIGEKQRIGIARALYKNATFFIFDESTSSLDKKTEDEFIYFLEEFKKDKTLIIISHNSSNLRICNRIIKIDLFYDKNNFLNRSVFYDN